MSMASARANARSSLGCTYRAAASRVGAQVIEAPDVARFERRLLLRAERVPGQLVVGERFLQHVLPGQRGQDLVEGVGGADHGCTHTAAQPVIHSGTGS